MRRLPVVLVLLPAVFRVAPAAADTIVLRDGRTLESSGPYVVKGRQALLKKPDGTLVSLPLSEIDVDKTAEARRKAESPASTPTPAARQPLTPAEAAKQKTGRKAQLVLTDDEVAQSIGFTEAGEKKDEDADRVEVTNVVAGKVPGGYGVTGSAFNSGKVDVYGVNVTIEAIGENNKTIASIFGQLAKDSLAPGEKSSFTAVLRTDKEATTFRYAPHWKVPVKPAASGGTTPGGSTTGGSTTGGSAAGEPTPAAAETDQGAGKGEKEKSPPPPPPTSVPRGDVAPRPANAPVGAPEKPGGTFLPKPTGDQPRTPGGS